MPIPSSGYGYAVMGRASYGGPGSTQPQPPQGGGPPAAGYPGAADYPQPGNTYPLQGRGQRPGYNPGQPFQGAGYPQYPRPQFPGTLNQPNPQMAFAAMQGSQQR